MHIDHIAIAVRDLDAAADRFCALFGYHRATERVRNLKQQVDVMFLRKPGSLEIKLIEPSTPESPLWPAVRRGGGLHHLCFKVADVNAACAELTGAGARLLSPPQTGEAFDDQLIAFLYADSGVTVEVIDTGRRRALLPGED
jgi:methylmalonyl-CoA/ethylmalonyl-CoA epimerase